MAAVLRETNYQACHLEPIIIHRLSGSAFLRENRHLFGGKFHYLGLAAPGIEKA